MFVNVENIYKIKITKKNKNKRKRKVKIKSKREITKQTNVLIIITPTK